MKTSDNTFGTQPVNDNLTSGQNLSVWFSAVNQPISYDTLKSNVNTDILIVGGGISGLTTAYCLAKEGRKVVLLEDGYVGSGESGRTTAHLTCALDDRYFQLEKIYNEPTAQLLAKGHMKAIEWLSETVNTNKIDCQFKKVDGYLFLHASDKKETLSKEYEASKRA